MGPARLQSAQRPEYDRRRNALRAARRPSVEPAGPGASARRARSVRRRHGVGINEARAATAGDACAPVGARTSRSRSRRARSRRARGNSRWQAAAEMSARRPAAVRRNVGVGCGASRARPLQPIATHCSPLRSSRPLRPIAPIAVARAPESAKPRRRPDRAAHMLRRHTASPPLRLTTSLPIPSSPRPLTALRPQPTPIVRRNADPDQKVSAADFF